MNSFKFEKEKYLQLVKVQGISAALTKLHEDTGDWEVEAFEGRAGYQPEMIKELEKVRVFSRELWEMALQAG